MYLSDSRRRLLAALIAGAALILSAPAALTQSSGGFSPGQTLTSSALNQALQAKQDTLNYTPLDQSKNLLDLQNPTQALINLGLGTLNASGGAPLINGALTPGDCLSWSASGIQDAGGACDSPIARNNIWTGTNTFSNGLTTTTLVASAAVSGAGFTNYFASPPPIGSNAPNTGTFSSLFAVSYNGYTPARAGANSDITSMNGLTTPLSIGEGGTGETSAPAARAAFGAADQGTYVAASDYGVSTANGDNGPNFNTALAAGKVVTLAPGVYQVATPIVSNVSKSGIVCLNGADALHNTSADAGTGCWLQWKGVSGGTILSFVAPTGSPSDGFLTGNIVRGISFDGFNGLAANGLVLKTVRFGEFANLYFQNFAAGYALDVNVVNPTSTSQFGDPCDTQLNDFRNISINQYNYSSSGIRLAAYNNASIPNNGCNASENTFYNIQIGLSSGEGILLKGADNNKFFNVNIGFTVANANYSLDFDIQNQNSILYPANSNTFYGFSAGNSQWIARGHTSYSTCVSFFVSTTPNCTGANTVFGVDRANGTPYPTIEPGAQLAYITTYGERFGFGDDKLVITDGTNGVVSEQNLVTTESLRIHNGSSNHIVLDDGTNSWGVNINGGTGNLRIARLVGSGSGLELEGVLNASGGVVGSASGAAAGAGLVGENLTQTFSAVNVPTTAVNLTSKVLTPGSWLVSGVALIQDPNGLETCEVGVSATSATLGAAGTYDAISVASAADMTTWMGHAPQVPFNVSANTTAYLVALCPNVVSGTPTAAGSIRAVRIN